jgi:prepilin-type processing-associated H-X9-DG protein
MVFEANFHKPNAFGLAKDAVYTRHEGLGNFGYVDGHVKGGRTAPPFGPVTRPAPKPRRR